MKLLVVKFENKVDLSALKSETLVTVNDGTTAVTGKVVTSTAPIAELESQLVSYNHPVVIRPAEPIP